MVRTPPAERRRIREKEREDAAAAERLQEEKDNTEREQRVMSAAGARKSVNEGEDGEIRGATGGANNSANTASNEVFRKGKDVVMGRAVVTPSNPAKEEAEKSRRVDETKQQTTESAWLQAEAGAAAEGSQNDISVPDGPDAEINNHLQELNNGGGERNKPAVAMEVEEADDDVSGTPVKKKKKSNKSKKGRRGSQL